VSTRQKAGYRCWALTSRRCASSALRRFRLAAIAGSSTKSGKPGFTRFNAGREPAQASNWRIVHIVIMTICVLCFSRPWDIHAVRWAAGIAFKTGLVDATAGSPDSSMNTLSATRSAESCD